VTHEPEPAGEPAATAPSDGERAEPAVAREAKESKRSRRPNDLRELPQGIDSEPLSAIGMAFAMAGARLELEEAEQAAAAVAASEASAANDEAEAEAAARVTESEAAESTAPESPAGDADSAADELEAAAASVEDVVEDALSTETAPAAGEAEPVGERGGFEILVAGETEGVEAEPGGDAATDAGSAEAMGIRGRKGRLIADITNVDREAVAKLQERGLVTVADLVGGAAAGSERSALAKDIGVDAKLLTEWVNRADLMRIDSVSPEWADLLEESGVDTCKELQHRVPANLLTKMTQVNAEKSVAESVPDVETITSWVAEAERLSAE
jgi:hypothetical protein